jgi:hypothetical protein
MSLADYIEHYGINKGRKLKRELVRGVPRGIALPKIFDLDVVPPSRVDAVRLAAAGRT